MISNSTLKLGDKYGKLTVLEFSHIDKKYGSYYDFLCDCGNIVSKSSHNVKTGNTSSCGCSIKESGNIRAILKPGDRYGKLVLVKFVKIDKHKYRVYEWKCDCGNMCLRTTHDVRRKEAPSRHCGCVKRTNHGQKKNTLPDDLGLKNGVWNGYIQSAKSRNLEFSLSKKVFFELIEKPCWYCNEIQSNEFKVKNNRSYKYNGIDRKNNSKGYTKSNSISCCAKCNRMKLTMGYKEFLNKIEQIYNKMFNKNTE